MSSPPATIPATASLGAARAEMLARGHSAYPIIDDEARCMGIVTRDDLLAASTDADAPVLDVASLDVVTAHPDLSVRDALGLMLGEDVDHLPVLDEHNQLIGICTRTDVLRAKMPQFHHEIRQPGWVPRRTRP